jgi:phage terminase large subunit GpA-like protein
MIRHDFRPAINSAVIGAFSLGRVAMPQTASEWADENFYLSAESSAEKGIWKTLPYQVAILNAMGNSDIPRVDVIKSARIGYTKCLMAVMGYFLSKKRKSVAFWQPTDGDRDEFVKSEVEPAIRDCGAWQASFPDYGRKSKYNTLEYKAFLGASLWLKGGTSAKNFRRISPDVAILDELDAFPLDIDGEGSADALSWKRCESSSFRKQIKGSSPKERGSSQIESSVNDAKCILRFNVKCPHCAGFAPLEFGGPKSRHGLKWPKGKPEEVLYHCQHCGAGWANGQLHEASLEGYYADPATGYMTKDALVWYRHGEICPPPKHISFHVWSAYSPRAPWREIVSDWIDAQGDQIKLKSFVNTTLGETWEAVDGEAVKAANLRARAPDDMPEFLAVTAGVDTQPDRWEVQWLGHAQNGDVAVLGYEIIAGETDRLDDWKSRLKPVLEREFDGMKAEAIGIDTGGTSTSTAYDYCALEAGRQVLAMKGAGGDRPIIQNKPARNWRKKGLDGWVIGTNAAKDVIFAMLAREDGPGRMVFPIGVDLPHDYFDQLTSERRLLRITKGRRTYQYEKRSLSARNEALDVTVYGIAAFNWLRVHRGLNLEARAEAANGAEKGYDFSALAEM